MKKKFGIFGMVGIIFWLGLSYPRPPTVLDLQELQGIDQAQILAFRLQESNAIHTTTMVRLKDGDEQLFHGTGEVYFASPDRVYFWEKVQAHDGTNTPLTLYVLRKGEAIQTLSLPQLYGELPFVEEDATGAYLFLGIRKKPGDEIYCVVSLRERSTPQCLTQLQLFNDASTAQWNPFQHDEALIRNQSGTIYSFRVGGGTPFTQVDQKKDKDRYQALESLFQHKGKEDVSHSSPLIRFLWMVGVWHEGKFLLQRVPLRAQLSWLHAKDEEYLVIKTPFSVAIREVKTNREALVQGIVPLPGSAMILQYHNGYEAVAL